MKVVIGTTHVGTQFIKELQDSFSDVEFVAAYEGSDQATAAADAEVFFGWPDGRTFRAAKRLQWIACPGMGIDRIVEHSEIVDSDIPVTNAPGCHVPSMADHVLGVMVGLAHRFQEAFEDRRARKWETPKYAHRIVELTGKTIGIHGLGAIGRAIAKRATAFDMTVLAVDPHPSEIPDYVRECWGPDRMDDLARLSDFLVVAAPVLDDTRNSINARRIGLMKRGSYIVVISRGGIVVEDALCDALESGHLAGAGIDATAVEPMPQSSRLWTLDNVVLTPHSSALTPELYECRRQVFKANLRRFLKGEPLHHICDKRAGF